MGELWEQITAYFERMPPDNFLTNIVIAAVTILVGWIIITILKKIINNVLTPKENDDKNFFIDVKLAQTLRVLFKTLVSYIVWIIVALFILYIFDIKIIETADIKAIGGSVLQALIIFAIARAVLRVGEVFINHIFYEEKDKLFIEEKRADTLSSLLQSVLRYVVYIIASIMVLQTFGVQTTSILASAGIAGLAIGFGAQNFVKDVISGFFIIFENQFSVGEYVTAAGITGTVVELGLRSTRIREWTGHLHTIPNGEITTVKNFERDAILATIEVSIAYEEDINEAIEVMRETCSKIVEEVEEILETPEVLGVSSLSDSSVDVLVIAKSIPGSQWAVGRELRKRFKNDLDAAGIEIPFPRQVLYHRNEHEEVQGELRNE